MQGAVQLLCNLQSLLCNASEDVERLWRCSEKCGVQYARSYSDTQLDHPLVGQHHCNASTSAQTQPSLPLANPDVLNTPQYKLYLTGYSLSQSCVRETKRIILFSSRAY